MSGLEVTMMKRIGELNEEVKRLKAEVGELCEAIKLASEVGIKMADEVTRLKAENERLRASSFVTAVPSEEYEKLKAEVERLTKAHSDALADFWAIHKGYFDLKAEVERLRKAGDDLFEFAKTADTLAHKELKKVLKAWNAAKEGRPNE